MMKLILLVRLFYPQIVRMGGAKVAGICSAVMSILRLWGLSSPRFGLLEYFRKGGILQSTQVPLRAAFFRAWSGIPSSRDLHDMADAGMESAPCWYDARLLGVYYDYPRLSCPWTLDCRLHNEQCDVIVCLEWLDLVSGFETEHYRKVSEDLIR